MIESTPGPDWRDLQRRVAAILNEAGFSAEETKAVSTARGTAEIDVYAVDVSVTPALLYFCECKRWRKRVSQGEVQAFRTVLSDAGAYVGIFLLGVLGLLSDTAFRKFVARFAWRYRFN